MPQPKLLVLFVFFLPACLLGQHVRQYVHTHFKTTDGLASAIVNNAVQDHKGFIWLSTINGLQRFDGNKFITFRNEKNNPKSLPLDDVTRVYQDSKKNLWILTADNKAGIFNTSNFQYKEAPIRNNTRQTIHMPKQFIETPDGQLLLLIRGERLYRYNPKSGEFLPDEKTIPFPSNWRVNHIAQDRLAQKYFLASDSGIAVFNAKTRRLNYRNHNPDNDPIIKLFAGDQHLNYAVVDKQKIIFFFQRLPHSEYLVMKMVNTKTNEAKQYVLNDYHKPGPSEVRGLLEQSNGRKWFYGIPFLAEFRDTANEPFHFLDREPTNELGIKFSNIYSLFEDREKNVWVSSDNGLYVFNPDAHLFKNYYLSKANGTRVDGRVQSVWQFKNGDIWMGSLNYGLFCYDSLFNPLPVPEKLKRLVEDQSVWQIHQHSFTGQIMLALGGGKIVIYNQVTKTTQVLTPPLLKNRSITQLVEDKAGNLWIGTTDGLIARWNFRSGASMQDQHFVQVTSSERIQKLLVDKQGFVWAAVWGQGVLKIDSRSNKVVYKISKANEAGKRLWSNTPTDIYQYNDSMLLIVSDALNLLNVRTNKMEHLSTHNGLPSNTVLSVAQDNTGVLWLGMVSGLCKAQLNKGSFVIYDRNDGILDDNFNIGGAFAISNNRLLFVSEQNFLVFQPKDLSYPNETNNVFITDVRLANTSLPVDSLMQLDKVSLAYNQNSITIEFNALRYNKLNKISYYYQLEGLSEDWTKAEDVRQAVYNYLPPGNYTFRVKTKNADGIFSHEEAVLFIRVYPPFWKAWWFYGIIALLLVVILYLIDRERSRRRADLQRMRSEIGEKLHEDISTTLNNINVLSQMARLKADRNIEKSKEFIEQIGDKSHSMAIAMDDMLWSIDPNNDGMDKTLLRILEFTDALENRHQAHIDVKLDEKLKTLELDMKVRYEFLLICKEALRCLVQYSECKRLLVNIDLAKSKIILKILSQGCELDPYSDAITDSKRQIGKRVAQINATFDFEINKDQTSIILSVPYKQHSRNGQLTP